MPALPDDDDIAPPIQEVPFTVAAKPLGALPGISFDNIGELLEQLEGPLHR